MRVHTLAYLCVCVSGRMPRCVVVSLCSRLFVRLVDLFCVGDQCDAPPPVFEAHALCLGDNYCMSNDIIVS